MLTKIRERGYKANGSISVSTDTRNLPKNCIFFALKGANFNGNKFALQALEKDAALAIVDEKEYAIDERFILVDDTLKALQELARQWREEWARNSERRKPVIGITGTNGKTTTKELMAAVLSKRHNVLYTIGNLNNQVGVPLTLLRLTDAHDMAIIEMGASHPGDIRELVEIAQPDYGLITNVGKAHLQGFGSFDGVMQTKAELYDWLIAHNGTVFINEDNLYLKQMLSTSSGNKTIACHSYHTGTMPQGTHLVGDYNSENVQAALCVGEYFGVNRNEGMEAIRAYIPSNNRSQQIKTEHNTLIVDAYNANPSSMQAAILNFLDKEFLEEQNNKLLILGDMLELGEYSHTEHQNIVNMLLEKKHKDVLLVGKEFAKTTAPYPMFSSTEELRQYLCEHCLQSKTILLKGSRGIHLETLIEEL